MRPKPIPAPSPIVKMRVVTLFANADIVTQMAESRAPATVTDRHPQRFTNELDTGPITIIFEAN